MGDSYPRRNLRGVNRKPVRMAQHICAIHGFPRFFSQPKFRLVSRESALSTLQKEKHLQVSANTTRCLLPEACERFLKHTDQSGQMDRYGILSSPQTHFKVARIH